MGVHGYGDGQAAHATKHRHLRYMLTCEQFDGLLEDCGRRCELCGAPDRDRPWERLNIDHAHEVGMWAVRGLLCRNCNAKFGGWGPTERVMNYMAKAWYLTLIRDLDISLDPCPEPPIGVKLNAPGGRGYFRCEDGWHSTLGQKVLRWHQLTHQFGAHNLRVGARSVRADRIDWAIETGAQWTERRAYPAAWQRHGAR